MGVTRDRTGPEDGAAGCIEVAVDLPVEGTFTYGVPGDFAPVVAPGKRVLVPFGERRVTGYVLGPAEPSGIDRLRPVCDVLDEAPLFPASMVPFFKWMASYYFFPVGAGIKGALPGGLNPREVLLIEITAAGEAALADTGTPGAVAGILGRLRDEGPLSLADLRRKTGGPVSGARIQLMAAEGLVVRRGRLRGASVKPRLERFVALARHPRPEDRLSAVKMEILSVVRGQRPLPVAELKKRVAGAARHVAALEKKGLLRVVRRRVHRDPFGDPIRPDTPPELTDEQRVVVSAVQAAAGKGFAAFLLAGVTGSGKTEVYMKLAGDTVAEGRSVLVLVPEIALITQMERRFRARFGENVAVLHSGLSVGERYDQWERIARGEAAVVVGARSAVFAPLADVGLIVVDEEHDGSYKQEGRLRYNARDLAVVRAQQRGAVVLLGSATPSVQSYSNALAGKFSLLTMKRRIRQRPLPKITVVDLRGDRDARGSDRVITLPLYTAIKETLARGEQALLFLNRRGYAAYPVCSDCGESLRCRNCSISLTLHRRSNAYRCHYCGYTRSARSQCPTCGSSRIKGLGLGTEKLESMVKELFPRASVARMDRDTTGRKGAALRILKGLRNRTVDILVGTQMVTKGHDFPNITLVGVVCADLSLNVPDFRAGERTFQLLAQVAGRAGRGELPGKVILQTYNPGHFSIRAAGDHEYETFYRQEAGFRKALGYPPFSRMVQLRISGRDEGATVSAAQSLGARCRELQADGRFARSVAVMGPIEAPIAKIAGRHRWQILLKGTPAMRLHEFVRCLKFDNALGPSGRDVRVAVDVDPYFMA